MASAKGRHGGRRPGSGRKPKAKERELIERLSPMEDVAIDGLKQALKERAPWAIKIFMEYRYGKPVQRTENKHEVAGLANRPPWFDES